MTQWEYKSSPTTGTDLAALGADGWELVCVDGVSMHFKRPMEPTADPEPAVAEVAAEAPAVPVEAAEDPALASA